MALPTSHLRPYRDYNEKDVINVYTLTGVSLPIGNGLLVAITGGGFIPGTLDVIEMLGDYAQGPGQAAFLNNVQAQRYGTLPKITLCQSGSNPLGLTLFDMSETDENGELLKYNPRKAAEIECVVSGQAMPVVTKGTFRISGFDANGSLTNTAGSPAYVGQNGLITTQALDSNLTLVTGGSINTGNLILPGLALSANVRVGTFLGNTGADGSAYVLLSIY
jgi:hypothetical protein